MRNALRLSFAYLRHYKKQTAALFVGILLSAALLTGVGSLFTSGKEAAKENARAEYGDWHYETRCDLPWFEAFEADMEKSGTGDGSLNGDGFRVEKYGIEIVKKAVAEPFDIQYVTGDDAYLEMMDRELLEGKMPEAENEMAADVQTLRNLGVPQELGARI